MNLKEVIFYALLIGLLCQCKILQYEDTTTSVRSRNNDPAPENRAGECFAKCLLADVIEIKSEEYAVFTGDEFEEDVEVEIVEIVLKNSTTEWVKKKADRNCGSPNPDDCMVWTLVEAPEEKIEIKVLVDTTRSENYEMRAIEYEVVFEERGHTEWRSVLCEEKVTTSVISQIQESLRRNNYYHGKDSEALNAEIKASLSSFQKENGLPIGQLDIETLNVLGIEVD